MKKLAMVGLAAVALAVPATGSAASTKRCGSEGSAVGNIRATGVSCETARRVVRADIQGKRYGGFKCTSRRYDGGANVTCKNGTKRVRFQVAD